ncbi:hypothetical protein MD484_g5216, partial [Candolleomyces efflorescens]
MSLSPALTNLNLRIEALVMGPNRWIENFQPTLWNQLKHLTLPFGGFSVARTLKLLSKDCPNLQSLQIKAGFDTTVFEAYSGDSDQSDDIQHDIVRHEHLEELNLELADDDLLVYLTLPKLRSLNLKIFSFCESRLPGLFRRSGCSLEYLSYNSPTGTQAYWDHILPPISPSLKVLEINTHNADKAMLSLIVHHTSGVSEAGADQRSTPSFPPLCPRLHRIQYKYTRYGEGTPPILRVIESRWNPPSHLGVARLEAVTVNFEGRKYQDAELDMEGKKKDLDREEKCLEEGLERLRGLPDDDGLGRRVSLAFSVASFEREYQLVLCD